MQKSWFLVIGLCSFINLSYTLDARRGPAPAPQHIPNLTLTLPVMTVVPKPQPLPSTPRYPRPSASDARLVYNEALLKYQEVQTTTDATTTPQVGTLPERLHKALASTEPTLCPIITRIIGENGRLAADNKTLAAHLDVRDARKDRLNSLLLEFATAFQEIKDLACNQRSPQENLRRIAHLAATALKKL